MYASNPNKTGKSRFNYIKMDRYFWKIIYIYNLHHLSKDDVDRKRTESFFSISKILCYSGSSQATECVLLNKHPN